MTLPMLGLLVVFSIALIIYALWPKGDEGDETVKRRMRGRSKKAASEADIRAQARESVTKQLMKRVTPIAMKPVMLKNPEEMSKLRMKLATAGFRTDNAPSAFLASKTIAAVGLGLAGLVYTIANGESIQSTFGISLFCAAGGFMAPNFWLSMAVGKRKETIKGGLPDTLDLMVISVESGLGLDAAMQRVSEEMKIVHPELAEELQIVTLEAQMGIPRSEALGNLTARTDLDEVRSLVGVINQAERFGTSIARALRNQSDALRMKRRQAAEERAQKTAVKLMAPLILFIFPAILVVLAGPAALTMMEALGNNPSFSGG